MCQWQVLPEIPELAIEKEGISLKAKRIFLAGVVLMLLILLSGCGRQQVQRHEMLMDTVATLSAEGPQAREAVDEGMERLRELDAMASPAGVDSDLQKLAESAGSGQWVPLHAEVYHMLEVSQEYSRRTDGAWDVTTGPLVALWGIGTEHAHVPSAEEIAQARARVGWQKLELQPETQSARLTESGMSLDLGGIAKGMALDEVRKIYDKHGIRNGLINLGASSLFALGNNDKGASWRIGIRHPRSSDPDTMLAVIPLSGQALSTSGDYERFFERDGIRYHHILDPRTGAPSRSGAMSDTIVVDGSLPDAGMLSDLLTTAVFVLGPEQGQDFLRRLPPEIHGMICSQDQILWPAHGLNDIIQQVHPDFTWHIQTEPADVP
ncbi:FAD:protein FMN transferase [Selenomonas sp. WCA-380-WT-3B 3/]|uniref:FAD:protein FMN transferase n=1 Tax=Selenomonas montiformis TaxID=2652285 RepID=A0A6I2URF8_9FIRM|nr:FAD:protein FMN transferase [Selenomonas montiformis]